MIEQFHSYTFNQEKTTDSRTESRVFIAGLFIIAKKYKQWIENVHERWLMYKPISVYSFYHDLLRQNYS